MANITNIVKDNLNGISNKIAANELKNFSSSAYGGMMTSLVGLDISQACTMTEKSDLIMRYHMMRNDIQKSVLSDGVGENAYKDGDSTYDSQSVPEYTYTYDHSYHQYSTNLPIAERSEQFVTRSKDNSKNLYLDYDQEGHYDIVTGSLVPEVGTVKFGDDTMNRDSLLYKTKKLFNANKIKTIISQFHTKDVEYTGQIGSQYGESHGRNLLTKNAENGGQVETYDGFDNPYCRVWTHHYAYDKFEKTTRIGIGNSKWGSDFEWDDNDIHHQNYQKEHSEEQNDEQKYDYAWKGHLNIDRINKYSVLDKGTGLVKIAPKYVKNGGVNNVHAKDCMFSIENLAWKDYDPYSFEQALSWEQRGPMGGRIMWFPPYNIKINETNTAKWNQNEFIGRGEPVYTYINADRSGTLSFTMLTDHPSSIDYASWYDDNENEENDYLRYFAGCGDGNDENDKDGLKKKSTFLTDEYVKEAVNVVKAKEEVKKEEVKVEEVKAEPEQPETVEFYVFFPNNYSGYYDYPINKDSDVHAILYLLFGKGAQKKSDGVTDRPINYEDINGSEGYEMINPLSQKEDSYIQGVGKQGVKPKWYYRIDSYVKDGEYGTDNTNTTNTITQVLKTEGNYIDSKCYKLNSSTNNFQKIGLNPSSEEDVYPFAEVACAMYSEKVLNKLDVYNYLINYVPNITKTNVEKLIGLFTNKKLTALQIDGCSSSLGHKNNNKSLATNRQKTITEWLREYKNFSDNMANITGDVYDNIVVSPNDINNVNGLTTKGYHSVHVKMEFSSITNTGANQLEGSDKSVEPETEQTKSKKFQEKDWDLITTSTINQFLKYGYGYKDDETIGDVGNIWYDSTNTDIKWYTGTKEFVENVTNQEEADKKKCTKYTYSERDDYGTYKDIIACYTITYQAPNGTEISEVEFVKDTEGYPLYKDFKFENDTYYVTRISDNYLIELNQKIINATCTYYKLDNSGIITDDKIFAFEFVNELESPTFEKTDYSNLEHYDYELYTIVPRERFSTIYQYSHDINDLKKLFKNEPFIYDGNTEYSKDDICFYNNEFYVAKLNSNEIATVLSNGETLTLDEGAQYKEYVNYEYIGSEQKGSETWDYYRQRNSTTTFVQTADSTAIQSKEEKAEEESDKVLLKRSAIIDCLKTIIPFNIYNYEKIETSNKSYKGEWNPDRKLLDSRNYEVGDVVYKDYANELYKCKVNLSDTQPPYPFDETKWDNVLELSEDRVQDCLKNKYTYKGTYKESIQYNKKDVIVKDAKFKIITNDIVDSDFNDSSIWKQLDHMDSRIFVQDEYAYTDMRVYKCTGTDPKTGKNTWEEFSKAKAYKEDRLLPIEYEKDLCIWKDNKMYMALKNWVNLYTDENIEEIFSDFCSGNYDNEKKYKKNYVILKDNEYYTPKLNDDGKAVTEDKKDFEWKDDEWTKITFYLNTLDNILYNKIATTLCMNIEDLYKEVFGDKYNSDSAFITDSHRLAANLYITYGTPKGQEGALFYGYRKYYHDSSFINTDCELESIITNNSIELSEKEKLFLSKYDNKLDISANEMTRYIAFYNIINNIDGYVTDDGETKEACEKQSDVSTENLEPVTTANENSASVNSCDENIWVDRGDGLLIQMCELQNTDPDSHIKSRDDQKNKLRYDQEYHFYQKYMADHPFVFNKLQEKIKYFNPAFHSMTPEGFNARLTFLNQCTRQGDTLTRSDILSGSTANNLAFGRPPFCILRLGDFYNQMIVIESVNYSFDSSGGLQWDLNPDGNGVQPMLCDVSINFKFIGGGDITGPVRRLQNAMSFNYYANTSFYDNRADRVEYEQNYKTMGGAGNNKMLTNKSYSYKSQLYNGNDNFNTIEE